MNLRTLKSIVLATVLLSATAAAPLVGNLITVQSDSGSWTTFGNYDQSSAVTFNATSGRYCSVHADLTPGGADLDVLGADIDAATGLVSDPIDIDIAAGNTRHPAIAWNVSRNCHLVAFDENGNVFAVLLNSDGLPIGGGRILVGNGNRPQVASDGTGWLVAWRSGGIANNLMGRLVDGSGAAQAAFAIQSNPCQIQKVAFGAGTDYLVAWRDAGGVWSRIVTPAGAVGAAQRLDAGTSVSVESLAVAANASDGEFLVGWIEMDVALPTLRRVRADGTVPQAPIAMDPGTHFSPMFLSLAWNDTLDEYIAAWMDDVNEDGELDTLLAAQLDGQDAAIRVPAQAITSFGASRPLGYPDYQALVIASRKGTPEVLVQWRLVKSDYGFPVQAQRVELYNAPPADPDALEQSHSTATGPFVPVDPAAAIFTGPPPPDGRMMTFRCGPMTDPDARDVPGLQVECTRLADGRVFTATQPRPVAAGPAGQVTVGPLPNGRYSWRARVIDYHGSSGSRWIAFPSVGPVAFEIDIPNQRPAAPLLGPTSTTGQFDDAGAAIGVGAATSAGLIHLVTELQADLDGDLLRLEVELRPIGDAFTGTPTIVDAFGPAGIHRVFFHVPPLSAWHWRAWTRDASGTANDLSLPAAFGSNADGPPAAIDFSRGTNAASPSAPTALAQYSANGTTALPLGGPARGPGIVLRGIVTDLQADRCALRVEVRPIEEPFDGTITAVGTMVESGQVSVVELPPMDYGAYHWRAGIVDEYGLASPALAAFGGNGDGAPADSDFEIPRGGSNGGAGCQGSASRTNIPAGAALLLLAVVGLRKKITE